MKRVVIVGAGIAGLAVAHALKVRRGAWKDLGRDEIEVLVVERSDRPGGNVRTDFIDGYTCEWGPNGFLDSAPETLDLVRALGIEDRVQVSDDAARNRFIYRGGRLHPLPTTPIEFARSGLLSWRGKIRIGGEPFAAPRPTGDETIHAFAARRIGVEAADVLIDSMVSGIFAGDARQLSLAACFPKMREMETEHGSLFRAFLALRKRKRRGEGLGAPAGRLTSFRAGTEEIIKALDRALGGAILNGARATGLHETPQPPSRFRVEFSGRSAIEADAVVLGTSAAESAGMVEQLDPALAAALREIPTAPLAVVCLGYEEASLPRPLDGFGFLIPRGEGPRILGVLWDSSIYPGRAPRGRVLMRAMIGGARDPGAVDLPDERLLEAVREDLRATMRLDAPPRFVKIYRHPLGIPQYTVGHLLRLERIEARLLLHPGLFVTGNSYCGVAINSCIVTAAPLAERVALSLRSP